MQAILYVMFAAHAIGISQAALDRLIDIAKHNGSSLSPILLRDRPDIQRQVGSVAAVIGASRAYVLSSLSDFCETAQDAKGDVGPALLQLRIAIPYAIRGSRNAVAAIFEAAGANGIRVEQGIERHFRDIHVAAQHLAAFPVHFDAAGRKLMGMPPGSPGW